MVVLSSSAEGPKAARTCLSVLQPNKGSSGDRIQGVLSFPSTVRLRKRREYLNLSGKARTCSVRGFLVVWLPNELQTSRLGVTVSKKVGCAVIRNRVKRYIRECFRHRRVDLPFIDLNVIARRESADMDYSAVAREIERAFSQIGSSICSSTAHSC